MPATSKAQFRYIAANRDKLEAQGMNTDEWLKGVKVSKLPDRKTASAMDFALPAAGALGGAYLGKLFRDKEDPEDDSYTKPLIGGAIGLGAGLLGNAAVGSMMESSRQAEAAKVNEAVNRHAQTLGLKASPYHGSKDNPVYGYEAQGRYVSPEAVQRSALEPGSVDWARELGPDDKGMYTLSPGMKVKPLNPDQAYNLGMNDVGDRMTTKLQQDTVSGREHRLGPTAFKKIMQKPSWAREHY